MSLQRSLSTAAASHPAPREEEETTAAAPHPPLVGTAADAAAPHPPWVMIHNISPVDRSSQAMVARLVEPPGVSDISAPGHLVVSPWRCPQGGKVVAASGDGLLLLLHGDFRADRGPRTAADRTEEERMGYEVQRLVCNPVSGEMLRLPDIGSSRRTSQLRSMGILTQADDHGRPRRFAVAQLAANDSDQKSLLVFLSEKGRWAQVSAQSLVPCEIEVSQEALAFGGKLWWADLTSGAVSVDPFSPNPEVRFVALPTGCVLARRDGLSDKDRADFALRKAKLRRIGVSEGRIRYAELSWIDEQEGDPALRSFTLDDDGTSWTLVHQVALSKVWENFQALAGFLRRRNSADPAIAVLDPLNANVIYLKISGHIAAVKMSDGSVIRVAPFQYDHTPLVPCVLPGWLRSIRIHTAGDRHSIAETTNGLPVKRARNSK